MKAIMDKTPIKKQIDFIKDRIENYTNVVNASISAGLIDEAILFEDFAKEICEAYYNQDFCNLNAIKPGWKCVDLKSRDGDVFIQVSVTKYSKAKITSTLKSFKELRKKEDKDVKDIKRITFFLLNMADIKSLSKENIDGIEFNPESDIVFLSDVIKKSRYDKTFRNRVYEYLYEEAVSVGDISAKLINAVKKSKGCFLDDIFTTIGNNGFHLDRSATIKTIRGSKSKIIVIKGDAGSGKSAICKEVIKDSEILLFARAEEVINAKNINDLWSIDLRKLLNYTKNKIVTFCIDSLEFVSDYLGKDKTIDELLLLTREYDNLKIFVTCRTRDYLHFQNLFLKYEKDLCSVAIDNLSTEEKNILLKEFPVLKKLGKSFSEVVTTPLYVDIIVKNSIDSNITSVAELKRVIYDKCICLSEKKIDNRHLLIKTVKDIVIERSKERKLGIDESLVDEKVLSILINNGVVLKNEKYGIRMKYDLFEDICFCQYLSDDFKNKESVDSFLDGIIKYGESGFRRYQIWIGDLIYEMNYDAVAEILIGCHRERYFKSTVAGILISDNCQAFISFLAKYNDIDYSTFIEICNEYAFEAAKRNSDFVFKPIGAGRLALLENLPLDLIRHGKINLADVIGLLNGLIQQKTYISVASKHISDITEEVFNLLINEEWIDFDLIDVLMTVPFYIQQHSVKWFIPLMNGILEKYLYNFYEDGKRILISLLKYHIEDSLNEQIVYSEDFASFMTDISYKFFTLNPNKKTGATIFPHYDGFDTRFKDRFGFSEGAHSLSDELDYRYYPLVSNFFITLIRSNFSLALCYLFKLADFAGGNLLTKENASKIEVTLANGINKSFVFHSDLFSLGESELSSSTFISDMFYVAKLETEKLLKNSASNKELCKAVVKRIYEICVKNSATVASLSLLSFIDYYLFCYYPDGIFALANSYEIVINDIILFHEENEVDSNKQFFENHIFASLGVPYKKKYDLRRKLDLGSSLYNLFFVDNYDQNVYKEKFSIIYSKYKKDKRITTYYEGYDGSIKSPKQMLAERKEQIQKKENYIDRSKYIENEVAEILHRRDIERAKALVDYILSLPTNEMTVFSRWLVYSISVIIIDKTITYDERNKHCEIWMNGIDADRVFVFDNSLILALVGQIKFDISEQQRDWIKRYAFKVLTSSINDIDTAQQAPYIVGFLAVDEELRNSCLNALIGCSTVHYEIFGNNPNKLFSQEQFESLKSKEEEKKQIIIEACLFNNKKFHIDSLDFKKCDPYYLEKACELFLTVQNCRLGEGLKMVGALFDKMMIEDQRRPLSFSKSNLAVHISKPLFADYPSATKTIEFLFSYISTHKYCRAVFETINRALCELESLLFASDDAKEYLFKVIDFELASFESIKELDINNEIKLGMAFIKNNYGSSKKRSNLSLNVFQKHKLIALYKLNNPICLNAILRKILTYPSDSLMPEVLEVINSFVKSLINDDELNKLRESKTILETFVCELYFEYRETIKSNNALKQKYQELLDNLSSIHFSKASIVSIYFQLL
ncbi:MAG: SMEK domain-containing protein [Bacilli bacterium]|nr:SMEK domain-containing protein [Bacilli bacterium]